jgi:hypothetical protein
VRARGFSLPDVDPAGAGARRRTARASELRIKN